MSEKPSTSSSVSPPPTEGGANASAAGPTPQMIGIRFVKAYYQTLSTTPDQIHKFYKPSSYLSHGEGSTPTTACNFESYGLEERWGEAQRFDFDNGAIDAQPSADGSILLVVTGHVVVKNGEVEERKGFVHTFFLALVLLPNKQKTYYVHNDILRFLKGDAIVATNTADNKDADVSATEATDDAKETGEKPKEEEKAAKEEEEPVKEEQSKNDKGGIERGGVEETKEEVELGTTTAAAAESGKKEVPKPTDGKSDTKKEEQASKGNNSEPKKKEQASGGKGKRQRGRGKSPAQQNAAKQQPAPKPTPGSWASLVASGSGPTAAGPATTSTPSKPSSTPAPSSKSTSGDKKEGAETGAKSSSKSQSKKEDKGDNTSSSKENGKGKDKDKPKRDPDNTLVVKNVGDAMEAEVLALFEKFAVQTNSKIVSSTISSHRGLAFVDFNSVAPVLAAVEQHRKEPIQLNGKVLEVDQKTAEQRARKARGGGGGGGGSPNQNNRGGRQNKRGNGGRNSKGNRGGGGNDR